MNSMQALLRKLKSLFTQLLAMENDPTPQGERIYEYAKTWVGKDASPLNLVPETVECAESISYVLKQLGYIDEIVTGTYTLLIEKLPNDTAWAEVHVPLRGDIFGYATGTGNGTIGGHVGIVGDMGQVMSNNSSNGIFDLHLTLASMKQRYEVEGGFKPHCFRRII